MAPLGDKVGRQRGRATGDSGGEPPGRRVTPEVEGSEAARNGAPERPVSDIGQEDEAVGLASEGETA